MRPVQLNDLFSELPRGNDTWGQSSCTHSLETQIRQPQENSVLLGGCKRTVVYQRQNALAEPNGIPYLSGHSHCRSSNQPSQEGPTGFRRVGPGHRPLGGESHARARDLPSGRLLHRR